MRWNQKYSKSKMFGLVEEYLSGGITQTALCNREGIKRGTFKYWHRKYQSEQIEIDTNTKTSVRTDFLSISVSDIVEHPCTQTLDLIYPNGVRLQLGTLLNTQGLTTIKQLISCLD